MVKRLDDKTPLLELDKKLQRQEDREHSEGLSLILINELFRLMKEVNKDQVSVDSLNASCNAASEIHKLLKLNFEMIKNGY